MDALNNTCQICNEPFNNGKVLKSYTNLYMRTDGKKAQPVLTCHFPIGECLKRNEETRAVADAAAKYIGCCNSLETVYCVDELQALEKTVDKYLETPRW